MNPRPLPERASEGSLFRLRASAVLSLLLYLAEPPDRTLKTGLRAHETRQERADPRILIKIVDFSRDQSAHQFLARNS